MSGKKGQIEDSEYYKRLGERIKALRIDADYLSAESFAIEIKMSRTQYLQYEKGRNMELSTIRKIALAHGITVEKLLSGLE